MKLSPLQSRLAASAAASILLLFFYFVLLSAKFASAEELKQETLPPIILDDYLGDFPLASLEGGSSSSSLDPEYEPEFAAFDRSIIGRAPAGVSALLNNGPYLMNVVAGTTEMFVFEEAAIFGKGETSRGVAGLDLRDEHGDGLHAEGLDQETVERGEADLETDETQGIARRQTSKTVYISANTCQQPGLGPNKTTMDPPQLTLYVSTSPKNTAPGPNADGSQVIVEFTEGAVMYNMTATGDVYLGVHAPNVSSVFTGQTYNVEVAASVDNFFHSYNATQDADLIWVDSDSQGALLITHNLTDSTDPKIDEEIMRSQPYVMFAQNKNDSSINGLKFSYCGLQNHAQIAATKNGQFTSMVTTGMTRRGPGNLPKQQFYFSGLNASTQYVGILALNGEAGKSGSGVVGGGGHVYRATNFTTKSDHGNCQIIVNLPFCDQVAYSAPSNPTKFPNSTALAQFYDDYASKMYSQFEKALAQISCEAPSTQRYSLVRNCSDCAAAYKAWLCSVTIPRCEDFSANGTWLQPRNLLQPFPNGERLDNATVNAFPPLAPWTTSRNPLIDQIVQPGPYKEVLPCEDLCYNLTQSCPSALGFACARPGMKGFNTSYGIRGAQDDNGEIYCNYPGSAHYISPAAPGRKGVVEWPVLAGLAVGVVVFGLL